MANVMERERRLRGLLRLRDVLAVVRVSRSTWYQWVREGLAPRPVRVGNVSMWREADIEAWLDDPEGWPARGGKKCA